ncbi:hypothetical protein H8B02_28420 [Bradyrhizobium sp. Pear77]|uniref:hypothetical protein n=1 Tax=Bradyrhizobium altum TaxID=1571202 RepID=UPI001E2A5BC3|nr:hypothetical protein [Bradyrhizobium altum]MCC8957220.1 hypothetical protein [Bradyrhizobium altum]
MLADWRKRAREGWIEGTDRIALLPISAESMKQWWRGNPSDPKAATAWLRTLKAGNVSDLCRTFDDQFAYRLSRPSFSLRTLFALLRSGRSVLRRFLENRDRIFGDAREGPMEDDRCDPGDCERRWPRSAK